MNDRCEWMPKYHTSSQCVFSLFEYLSFIQWCWAQRFSKSKAFFTICFGFVPVKRKSHRQKKYLSLILTWIECNKTYETNTNITSFHAHTFDCWFVFLRNLVDCVCCWFRYNTHASKFSHKNTVTQRPIELISCVYECRWFVFEWIFRFLLRSYFFLYVLFLIIQNDY